MSVDNAVCTALSGPNEDNSPGISGNRDSTERNPTLLVSLFIILFMVNMSG